MKTRQSKYIEKVIEIHKTAIAKISKARKEQREAYKNIEFLPLKNPSSIFSKFADSETTSKKSANKN